MPPTARLPTVEFRSLLLPPIRLRLRTLQTFARPHCTPVALQCARPATICFAQRRSLHLYKTARAKTALGMHKVLDFEPYQPEAPSTSNHRINIVKSEKDLTLLDKELSLQDVYDKYISPGKFLYMVTPISKKVSEHLDRLRKDDIPSQTNNYAILEAHTTPVQVKNPQTETKQLGALKGVNLLLSNPVAYTKIAFDRMYQFVENGLPVEVRIRIGAVPRRNSPPPDPTAWPWLNAHFPHLRPDFILKSMPEGTKYIIKPVSDGRLLQFVLGREVKDLSNMDLTKRLFKVKTAVQESMGKNKMAQNWAARRGRSQHLEGTSEDTERKVSAAKVKKPITNDGDDNMLDGKRLEQIMDATVDGGSKGEAGHVVEKAQSVEEAVQRLNVAVQGTQNTPGKYHQKTGMDRRGRWEKPKKPKPYTNNDKTPIPKTRGQGYTLSKVGEIRHKDYVKRE